MGEKQHYPSQYGRDEREQGARYHAEEEWRPWPRDAGYASNEAGYGRDIRQRHERAYSSGYSPRTYEDNAHHAHGSYGGYSPSEARNRGTQQQRQWGGTRYPADNDFESQALAAEHESFRHQLREAGQKIARALKSALRGPRS